jgi:hypothetical protein
MAEEPKDQQEREQAAQRRREAAERGETPQPAREDDQGLVTR